MSAHSAFTVSMSGKADLAAGSAMTSPRISKCFAFGDGVRGVPRWSQRRTHLGTVRLALEDELRPKDLRETSENQGFILRGQWGIRMKKSVVAVLYEARLSEADNRVSLSFRPLSEISEVGCPRGRKSRTACSPNPQGELAPGNGLLQTKIRSFRGKQYACGKCPVY
jgi:hypothetical protein